MYVHGLYFRKESVLAHNPIYIWSTIVYIFFTGGAIMLVVYEQVSHYLETEWDF